MVVWPDYGRSLHHVLKMMGGLVGGDKDQAVTTDGGQRIIERPGLLTLTKSIH